MWYTMVKFHSQLVKVGSVRNHSSLLVFSSGPSSLAQHVCSSAHQSPGEGEARVKVEEDEGKGREDDE